MDQLELFPVEALAVAEDEIQDPGSTELTSYIQERQVTFREAMERFEPVSAHYDPVYGSYIVMSERELVTTAKSESLRELGYAVPSPWTSWTREEWNTKLRDRQGLREYYKMKRTDGSVRGSLRQLKTPILAARWIVNPFSQSTRDKNVAEFVAENLFRGMSHTWAQTIEDVLLMCEYGYMPMEKVYTDRDVPGRITLRKLAPRHPMDIRQWNYDRNGGPDSIEMEPLVVQEGGAINVSDTVEIPIRKLAVFSLEAEAGDLRGISILRSAYKHWYYKDTLYKIDAIQKERHGIGVPIIKLPPSPSDADKKLADDMGRNLRTNERGHIVLPAGWEILFAKLEGQPVDCIKSIEHHDKQIAMNILAPFMHSEGAEIDEMEMFLRSTRYIGACIADVLNKFVIKELVDMNFRRVKGYPELKARRIGEEADARTRSFTGRNWVGAGVIIPDDPLEAHVREELDLPPADPTTARITPTPQGPDGEGEDNSPARPGTPRVGPPRQQPTPPGGVGRGNTGIDRSGKSKER